MSQARKSDSLDEGLDLAIAHGDAKAHKYNRLIVEKYLRTHMPKGTSARGHGAYTSQFRHPFMRMIS